MKSNELGNTYELQELLLGWHEIGSLFPKSQGPQSSPCLPSLEGRRQQGAGRGTPLREITFFSIVPTGCERKIEHPLRPCVHLLFSPSRERTDGRNLCPRPSFTELVLRRRV